MLITDNARQFSLDPMASIDLEGKLNVTTKGKLWVSIGDHLYAFGTNKPCSEVLIVTSEQWDFLHLLRSMHSYKECYDL